MYPLDLSGSTAFIFGVANHRSIAWAIARILHKAGARLAIGYQNERVRATVAKLVEDWNDTLMVECDVSDDDALAGAFERVKGEFGLLDIVVHSVAFAQREDLGGRFIDQGRDGFRTALDISAYSLVPIARHASEMMVEGGAIITLTFQASQSVFPGYNIMGTAKAALENEVRQLAWDLGKTGIRINALSAGPVDTLSSRVISGYRDMKRMHSERSPMGRNITVDEVAKTALYLCSDLSSGVTGEIVHVDTGYNIMGI